MLGFLCTHLASVLGFLCTHLASVLSFFACCVAVVATQNASVLATPIPYTTHAVEFKLKRPYARRLNFLIATFTLKFKCCDVSLKRDSEIM